MGFNVSILVLMDVRLLHPNSNPCCISITVSILVLMDVRLLHPNSNPCCISITVSILVLMDVRLLPSSRKAANIRDDDVSILVLMDVRLLPLCMTRRMIKESKSFNPCFNGCQATAIDLA